MSETERSTSTRRAILVGQNIAINGFLFVALGVYLVIDSGAWQGFAITLLAAETVIGGFWAASLIRHGKPTQGGWIMLTSDLVAPALASLTVVNLGYVAITYILVSAYFIIAFAIDRDKRRMATAYTFVALLFPIASLVFNPAWQLESSLVLTLTPIFTAVLGAVLVVVVVRQVWASSMRNKLLVAFIGVTVIATGVLAVYTYISTTNILQESLENELTQHVDGLVASASNLLHEQVQTLTAVSLNELLQQAVVVSNHAYTGDAAATQAQLEAKDAQWRAADAADNNADPLVQEHLTNEVALDLIEFQQSFPEHIEVFITDAYGGLAGTTNRTSDYYQADESWWQAAYNNGEGAVYVSQPEFDESTGQLGIQIALPLRNRDTGEVVGILRSTFDASEITTLLEEKLAQTDETDIFFPGETIIHSHQGSFEPVEAAEFEQISSITGQGMIDMDYEGVPSVVVSAPVVSAKGDQVVDKLGWVIFFHQQYDEAFAPVNASIRGVLIVVAIVLALAAAAAFGLALILVRPITQLTQTAEEIAGGNIDTRAEVSSDDEVGTLAKAFNTMTAQLRDFIGTLEQRVEERTRDQAVVAEVATQIATIQNLDEMLATMVHLTQRGFGLYHAHVFIYHEDTNELQIVACGYKEGDEHEGTHGTTTIALDAEQSLVARCARNREPVIVNDVHNEPGWLPNPVLPDTKAEMAVPMIVGDKLLGVLDVQAEDLDAFTQEDAVIESTLAAQVAVAMQNLQEHAVAQKMASDLNVVAEVGIAAATISDANQLLQEVVDLSKESFNLYHAHIYLMDEAGETLNLASGAGEVGRQMVSEGRSIPLNSEKSLVARAARTHEGVVVNDVQSDPEFLPNPLLPETHAEMAVPMLVGGKVLGVLDVQSETVGRFTDIDVNIKTTLASQVAVALENARSFQKAQKQAERESKLNLITQKIQGAATIEEAMQVAARELGHALGKRQTLVALDPAVLAGDGGKKVVNE